MGIMHTCGRADRQLKIVVNPVQSNVVKRGLNLVVRSSLETGPAQPVKHGQGF